MNDDDKSYCWCGTRLTIDTDVLRLRCSAHGYQDRAYGPTPPAPTIPWAWPDKEKT